MGGGPFRLARLFWALVPMLSVVTAIFLTILPYGQVWGRFPTPALALIPLFYWSVHRPTLLPPGVVFLMGLFQDLATAGPVGLWPVVYLIAYSATLSQRAELETLPMRFAWGAFAGITLLALFGGWFGACLYKGGFLPALPTVFQALTTAGLFPVLVWPLVLLKGELNATMRH